MTTYRSPCGTVELRCGRWQDVLADVAEVDAVVTDPPYSERTHSGHDDAVNMTNGGSWKRGDGGNDRRRQRRGLSYSFWTRTEIDAFVGHWSTRCRGWFAAMSDSVLTEEWCGSLEATGLTGFHPLPCIIRGMSVRLCGDGPSSWAVYLNVARPKRLSKWGTLPGEYRSGQGERLAIGGKPLTMMRAIIRDYTRPGDLICDPCAGGGTTLLAAAIEGRRAIGAEMDSTTFEKAVARLKQGWTQAIPIEHRPKPKQGVAVRATPAPKRDEAALLAEMIDDRRKGAR